MMLRSGKLGLTKVVTSGKSGVLLSSKVIRQVSTVSVSLQTLTEWQQYLKIVPGNSGIQKVIYYLTYSVLVLQCGAFHFTVCLLLYIF